MPLIAERYVPTNLPKKSSPHFSFNDLHFPVVMSLLSLYV